MKPSSIAFDLKHIWHPYSSLTQPIPPLHVESAKGVEIHLKDGTTLIDGMASWWSAIHGYNHPALNKAAKDQIDNMSHVMFGGLTHDPAIALCQQLINITPETLTKVFLSDSGSVAVDVAMAMPPAGGERSSSPYPARSGSQECGRSFSMAVLDLSLIHI